MKTIPLTQGLKAMVDDDMFPIVSEYRWHALRAGSGNTWYAACAKWSHGLGVKRIMLHHVVVGFPLNKLCPDHIDRNGLNNCRNNLRIVTRSENNFNRLHKKSVSNHCFYGHEYTQSNIYLTTNGHRECVACRKRVHLIHNMRRINRKPPSGDTRE